MQQTTLKDQARKKCHSECEMCHGEGEVFRDWCDHEGEHRQDWYPCECTLEN